MDRDDTRWPIVRIPVGYTIAEVKPVADGVEIMLRQAFDKKAMYVVLSDADALRHAAAVVLAVESRVGAPDEPLKRD